MVQNRALVQKMIVTQWNGETVASVLNLPHIRFALVHNTLGALWSVFDLQNTLRCPVS